MTIYQHKNVHTKEVIELKDVESKDLGNDFNKVLELERQLLHRNMEISPCDRSCRYCKTHAP